MPVYEFECQNCEHIWDDIMSFKDPIPDVCPECLASGHVRKLISLPARGKVELVGDELVSSIMSSAKSDHQRATKDENFYANIVGEAKHHNNLIQSQKTSAEVNSVIKDYRPSFYKSQTSKKQKTNS